MRRGLNPCLHLTLYTQRANITFVGEIREQRSHFPRGGCRARAVYLSYRLSSGAKRCYFHPGRITLSRKRLPIEEGGAEREGNE